MSACRLCRRERTGSSQFCEYHLRAMRNLEAAYAQMHAIRLAGEAPRSFEVKAS